MFKYIVILTLIFSSFLLSCSPNSGTNISTYTISQGDFTNVLLVNGIVEPVLSTTLTSPRNCDGVVQYLVEDGVSVKEGDVICIIEFQELQNQYDQISISLENAEAGLNKTKADLNLQYALLEAQVKTNEADTKISRMDSLQLAFLTPNQKKIKELELEKVGIEKARYEKKISALRIIQQSEIKRWELEIQRLAMRVKSVKEQLDALTIKAPRNGLTIRAICPLTGTKYQVGDPVWSAMPLVIMPEFKEMKVKIMASETDYKNISVNDSVYYTFDAMPGNSGFGRIVKKAPVGQPYKRGGKVKYFEIEASVDSIYAMPEPGFTANCHIILKQTKNALIVPQIALFEEDSMKVVYVKKKKGYEMRQVLTGVSSLKESVISAGLSAGDVISLSKPNSSLIKERVALPDSLTKVPESPNQPENAEEAIPLSPP